MNKFALLAIRLGEWGPDEKVVLKTTRNDECGYEVRTERFKLGKGNDEKDFMTMESAYSLIDNGYIGNVEEAEFLCKKGIKPQLVPGANCCSIGFCEKDQKWYGWSHRAIIGFEIGNKIFEEQFGDNNTLFIEHGSQTIKTLEEAKQSAIAFANHVSSLQE